MVTQPTSNSGHFKHPEQIPKERGGLAALTVFICTLTFSSLMYYPYTAPLLFHFNNPGNCLATLDGRRMPSVCSLENIGATFAIAFLLFLAGVLVSGFIGWKVGRYRTKLAPFIVLMIVSVASFFLISFIAFMWGLNTVWLE
jgi:MFS family permease